MLKKLIEEIEKQGESFAEFTNEWNVMQQLVDIVSYQPESADIVFQDIKIDEMNLDALAKKVTGKRIGNPKRVMEMICDFYKIPCPDNLPPEMWRNEINKSSSSTVPVVDLIDLL